MFYAIFYPIIGRFFGGQRTENRSQNRLALIFGRTRESHNVIQKVFGELQNKNDQWSNYF